MPLGRSMKVQGGFDLSGTHQLLFCADVYLLGEKINTLKENTGSLLDASMEIGLEVNTEKTEYMFTSEHQNTGQNHNVKVASKSLKTVANLQYLGTTVTSQNCIHEEIRAA
jgi:hypothetical protein